MDGMMTHAQAAVLRSAVEVRHACRSGAWRGPTSGLARGYAQANLAILPAEAAGDFLRFCQRNPKPCPLLGVSEPGDPRIPELGLDLDLRTDLPGYRVWQDGEMVDQPHELGRWWRDDLVTFAIGCSLSFETAMLNEGIPLRHCAQGTSVPMYRTDIACAPAGRFHGPMVVSMRPLVPADAIRAVQITSRFPAVHGAPVHLGFPEAIGIRDLATPDYGDPVAIKPGEIPVFWACGVTPQSVIAAAGLPFAITHIPGHMLVVDQPDHAYSIL